MINEGQSTIKKSDLIYMKNRIKLISKFAPYAISTTLLIGLLKTLGVGAPLYMDNEILHNVETDHIYKDGNVTSRYTEEKNPIDLNTLNHYTEWEYLPKEDSYQRIVTTYNIGKLDLTMFREYYLKNSDLKSVIGKPVSTKTIKTKELKHDQSLNNEEYIEVRIYNQENNDFIIKKEPVTKNIKDTLIFIISNILVDFGVMVCSSDEVHSAFKQKLNKIRKEEKAESKTLKLK